MVNFILFTLRRVWRYQRGNQNLYIEEEQKTQWPKEKVQKDKQQSTKHTHKTKDRVTRTLLKFACHAVSVNYTDKYLYDYMYLTGNIRVLFQPKKTQYIRISSDNSKYFILIAQEKTTNDYYDDVICWSFKTFTMSFKMQSLWLT
jgi:hypothetical protein